MKKITIEELTDTWKFKPSEKFKDEFNKRNLHYIDVNDEIRDQTIVHVLNVLDLPIRAAGIHRNQEWEKGWEENLTLFTNSFDLKDLKPKYFSKYELIRWKQKWIQPLSKQMDVEFFELLQYYIFEKYLGNFEYIYEFGCGTGHNLLRIRELNKFSNLVGLDWAKSSQKIIEKIAETNNDKKLTALHFDYFNPNYDVKLQQNTAVLTVASLEQIGENFSEFIDYLLVNKPKIVIHIEPLEELLDEENLLDNLSLRYFRKRNYLTGLVTHISNLEEQGLVKVVETSRSFLGSLFIDGYSILVWKPIENQITY